MKTSLIATSLALVPAIFSLGPIAQAPAPQAKAAIAYVSAQRIFAESVEGKAQLAKVQAMQQERAADLRSRQQTLEATRQQLAQADGAARVHLQQQELQQQTDLARATAQAQADLQTLQRQAQADVQGRVKTILDDVAKSQNIQLVLNGDTSVVWSAPGTDLTGAVVERLNSNAATAAPKPSPKH